MPLVELEIAPGLVTERTERGAKGRYRDGNRVRFRQGLPEKIGGWQERSLGGEAMLGIPRSAADWQSIAGQAIVGVGTHRRLYHAYGGTLVNITPYRLSTSNFGGSDTALTDPFDTVSGSSTVNVSHTGHGVLTGARVFFDNATAVGGLTIDGEYEVVTVVDSDNYEIDAGSNASSTATGGGTVHYAYEINPGSAITQAGLGYGAGTYGTGTYGTPRTTSGILLAARTWALDTWGEDLIVNPRYGGIYIWDTSAGFTGNRATLIDSTAPSEAAFVIVSPVDRHLIAFGCTPVGGSSRDPLVIRWCSQNDYTSWTSSRTNTAGQRRIDGASEIMSALRVREEILVFTDVSLYALTFVGPTATYNLRQIGGSCGLVGPLARGEFGGVAFWMSYEDFFFYDGTLGVLPCPIRNHIYDDINRSKLDQIHCAVNTLYQEVWFFYCSEASAEIDRYAIFQIEERHWSFGELERTAWLDRSAVRSTAAAFSSNGTFFDHEVGATDNGAAMGEFLETWDVEIPGPNGAPPGDHLLFVRRLVPDFLVMTGPMKVTQKGRKYPHGEQITKGPFDVATSDAFIRPRIRARQMSLRVESDQDFPDTRWRADTWRMDVRPHGRR